MRSREGALRFAPCRFPVPLAHRCSNHPPPIYTFTRARERLEVKQERSQLLERPYANGLGNKAVVCCGKLREKLC